MSVSYDEYMEILSFLYKEAMLLDDKKYKEWLSLLTEDFEYKIFLVDFVPYTNEGPKLITILDEDRKAMERRINRLYTEYAWAEDPQSHTLRVISNVMIESKVDNVYNVRSYLVLHRDRGDLKDEVFYAKRNDKIVKVNEGYKLSKRDVIIMESILRERNVSLIL
ncbi:aromatic-ring-hydroxylating dioxygenase subunit beta [Sulfolobus tengchongensis]|uniref:Aromatic-ring-hydroxylating dioxygenase subunit beta n=1 Tax=Sulfolobus tengchongensis TaxID=207809 RepID=A0AAX4L2A7_9CREN